MKKKYQLEGGKIQSLEDFFSVFGEMVNGTGGYFGKDLDSFDDCLFGGYGLDGTSEIEWKNHKEAAKKLGYQELASWCRNRIKSGDYLDLDGLDSLNQTLENAEKRVGPTLFDKIVETINSVDERSKGKHKITLVMS